MRDLLGVVTLTAFDDQRPSRVLAEDHAGELTTKDWNAYLAVGEAIAAQVMADPDLRGRFLACTPSGDGRACLRDTIVEFGRRAFRRPLAAAEVARFERIMDRGAQITATGAPEELAEVILETFLVSPSFIQRSEIAEEPDGAGHFALSSYEVASRLSYLLWGSIPDDVLSQAADAGELASQPQIRAQGERMLKDDRARELAAAFHQSYLRAGPGTLWVDVTKDAQRFPDFSAAVVTAMNEETERFFDTVVFVEQGSFQDLFLSPIGFVNRDTAALYGLPPARFGVELQRVTLSAAERPGFLTRVGFLAAHAHPDRGAPALRGAFITSQVLGLGLVPPHPSADVAPPKGFRTNREWVEEQTSPAACAACHSTFLNPPGFVLEAYDAVGAFQTVEADTGATIDTVADVTLDGESLTIREPRELMLALAESWDARQAYAKRWVAFAYEREDNPLDACAVDSLTSSLGETGYTVLDLLVDLTQTESFRLRAREVTP